MDAQREREGRPGDAAAVDGRETQRRSHTYPRGGRWTGDSLRLAHCAHYTIPECLQKL